MRIKIFVFLIAMFLLNARYGFCEGSAPSDLVVADFGDIYLYYVATNDGGQFCYLMLEDLKLNKYKIVKPIVSVGDYQDPSLKVYTDKCPGMLSDKDASFESKNFNWAETTLLEKEQEENGMEINQTKNFRIYHIDLDNNPKNGKEFVFYSVGNIAKFRVVDFSSCKEKGIFWSAAEHYEDSREGIMYYAGKHYIYYFHYDRARSSYFPLRKVFTLRVGEYRKIADDEESKGTYSPCCLFRIVHTDSELDSETE